MICGLGLFQYPGTYNKKEKIMRNFALAASAVLALSLVACGDKDEEDTAAEDTAAEEVAQEEEEETE